MFLSFVFGFVRGFAAFGPRSPDAEVDDIYVSDMARPGISFGLSGVPTTVEELHSRVDTLAREIDPSEESRQLVSYLKDPPSLGRVGRLENRMVLCSASSLLPESLRKQAGEAGVPVGDHLMASSVTKALIGFVRWSFGPDPNLDEHDLNRSTVPG